MLTRSLFQSDSQIENRKSQMEWCGCRESHPDVLPGKKAFSLLNHSRMESKRAGSVLFHTPGPRHFNKEQTPLAILRYQPTVSRWFFRCLGAHLLRSP